MFAWNVNSSSCGAVARCRRRVARRALAATTALLILASPALAGAGCPPAAELWRKIAALGLETGPTPMPRRLPAPHALFREAVQDPGVPSTERQGRHVFGVLVADLPIETLWKAINDEDHHASYLPVRYSEVVAGAPRGQDRRLFQYVERLGAGRWWVSHVQMNAEVYRDSGAALWQLYWKDDIPGADRSRPPVDEVTSRLEPIRGSAGSWLLARLDDRCTLVEYSGWSDPGGALAKMQFLVARRTTREILEGVVRLATEHLPEPHPGARFERPDGTLLP